MFPLLGTADVVTYSDITLRISTGMVNVVRVSQCDTCGAIVYDQTAHDAFHEQISSIGATARQADNTAQLFRPLGSSYSKPVSPVDLPDLRESDEGDL